jgi:coenzyme F420-reducing hydrogenase alpha subunit
MSEEVKDIDVITRVEGHAKVTFILDRSGRIEDARFHVLEFKGFEKFMQGRVLYDAPRITTRICGICPVSHHLASVKACEDLLDIEIPETAKLLRELMHMGQYIHSHTLHFFMLAAPDFILGPDTPPETRNLIGLLNENPDLVKNVVKVRKFGQDLIEFIGGKAIHPVTAIPGGMSKGLADSDRTELLDELKILKPIYEELISVAKSQLNQHSEFINNFSVIDTYFMGLTKNDALELYDGDLRVADKNGKIVEDVSSNTYFHLIAEHSEPWTYLKFPFLRNEGWPEGIYRVGPLARVNICEKIDTPKAHNELQDFRAIYGQPANQTLAYHHARLVELLYAFEKAEQLLGNSNLSGENFRIKGKTIAGEGIGIVEAPRGTLIHHYKANSNGKLTDVNLIVATVNNNPSINQSVKAAAQELVKNATISNDGLNKIEMAIRAYDPCLTCAAHSLNIVKIFEFRDEQGNLIKKIYR